MAPPSEQDGSYHKHTIHCGESRHPTFVCDAFVYDVYATPHVHLVLMALPHNDITPQDMVCKYVCACVCVYV